MLSEAVSKMRYFYSIISSHQQEAQLADVANNGAIVGQSLDIQGNNYTSQLNVIITPETAGKTIVCAYDPLTGQNITSKFSTRIPTVEMHIFAYNYRDIMRLSLPARGTKL